MFKSIPLALAAALFVGSAASAAVSTTDLNMRSGPGPGYPVIGVIPANAPVAIGSCAANTDWCMVNAYGMSGWADTAYLARGGSFSGLRTYRYLPRAGATVTYGSTAPFIFNNG